MTGRSVIISGSHGFLNGALFLAGSVVAMRLIYPASYAAPAIFWNALGGEYARFAAAHAVAFAVLGAASAFWSRTLATVVVPAFLVVWVGLAILGQAMYATDVGPPPAIWLFMLTDVALVCVAAVAAAFAGLAWWGVLAARQCRRS